MTQTLQPAEILTEASSPRHGAGRGLEDVVGPAVQGFPTPVLPPREQLAYFIDALFEPGDLVELRVIAAKQTPQNTFPLRDRRWLCAERIAQTFGELTAQNQTGRHVYFGVNPRSRRGGTKNAVTLCRSVWLDFDRVSFEEAQSHWSAVVPDPKLVVRSGTGIHAYWRLAAPYSVESASSRSDFENIVKGVARAARADATHDVTRLLRLPGFANPKTTPPLPCTLLVCEPDRRFSIVEFERWATRSGPEQAAIPLATENLPAHRNRQRIQGLLRHLDKEVTDRSRRDFGVVCGLLRLGLSPDEIRPLVAGRSKFAENEAYVEITIQNAVEQLFRNGTARE